MILGFELDLKECAADSAKSYNDVIGPGAEMERCPKRVAGVA